MVQINFAQKSVTVKIVYYGPGMSGKTTNLEVVHQRAPDTSRGDLTSISTDGDRTLFFDFMPLDLGTVAGMRTQFQIYTVPGQVYYNSTRKLVLQGVDGVIFIADSSASMMDENLESLRNLQENLAEYGKEMGEMPMVIQYNKRDLPDALPVEQLEAALNPYGAPSFEACANTGQGVFPTLKAIAATVLDTILAQTGAGGAGATGGGTHVAPAPQATLQPPAPIPAPAPQAQPAASTAPAPAQPVYEQQQEPQQAPQPQQAAAHAQPEAPPEPAAPVASTGYYQPQQPQPQQQQQPQPAPPLPLPQTATGYYPPADAPAPAAPQAPQQAAPTGPPLAGAPTGYYPAQQQQQDARSPIPMARPQEEPAAPAHSAPAAQPSPHAHPAFAQQAGGGAPEHLSRTQFLSMPQHSDGTLRMAPAAPPELMTTPQPASAPAAPMPQQPQQQHLPQHLMGGQQGVAAPPPQGGNRSLPVSQSAQQQSTRLKPRSAAMATPTDSGTRSAMVTIICVVAALAVGVAIGGMVFNIF